MLCGALKETNRLPGAVVIVVVVGGAGVQGIDRMRVGVNARFLEIFEEMMNPVRRRCGEKKDEERDDSQRDERSRIKANCVHG
jgi:hypothetical protein